MASIIFNSFKKRFLQGKVPSADTWHFIPVNSAFKAAYEYDNIKLEQYRTVDDFAKAKPTVFNYKSTENAQNYNNEVTNKAFGIKGRYVKGTSLADKFSYQVDTIRGDGLLAGSKVNRLWYKVMDDDSLSNKPMYITDRNFDAFNVRYGACISSNSSISSYLSSGGFYFIRSKDELAWFADRTNQGNNRIIGILGDNIEGVIDGNPIGVDEKQPFEGIIDGNGYTLRNITIDCSNVDNGLVGVLGAAGVVKNFNIINDGSTNTLECKKQINLTHIKSDARDVNAGILVGRNYGTIQNINAYNLGWFKFSGFVPEVYSVTNKSDKYSWKDNLVREKFDEDDENYYFLNSWCINSPGNVCPYVGYFAEGYYGEDTWGSNRLLGGLDNANENTLPKSASYYADGTNRLNYAMDVFFPVNDPAPTGIMYMPLNATAYNGSGWNGFGIGGSFSNAAFSDPTKSGEMLNSIKYISKLPVYMGVDNKGYFTCSILNNKVISGICPYEVTAYPDGSLSVIPNHYEGFASAMGGANICYNNNLIRDINVGDEFIEDPDYGIIRPDKAPYCPSAYCQTSLRMNPIARAAYNIGVIAGSNYGTITNVVVKTNIQNTSNFVGFVGGIAGKQGYGQVLNTNVEVNNVFNYDGADESYRVTYKTTPLLPQSIRNKIQGYRVNGNVTSTCNADYLFSAFYDKDETVNTATDVLDDCITYHTRPIFIAGGMFGRYIPSYAEHYENTHSIKKLEGCLVSNCKIVYSDNFEETNYASASNVTFKRIENAMGAVIGKVDYSTETNTTMFNIMSNYLSMNMVNCVIHTNSTIGEPVYYKPFTTSAHNGSNIFTYIPDTAVGGYSNTRNVGIYEIKFNPANNNVLSVNDTSAMYHYNRPEHPERETMVPMPTSGWSNTAKLGDDTIMTDTYVEGGDSHYLYVSDYPFMINYGQGGPNSTFWANWDLAQGLDVGFKRNLGLNCASGFNKRNVAHELVKMNSCVTNVSPALVLYDDFWNTWGDPNPTTFRSEGLNIPHSKKWHLQPSGEDILWSDVYQLQPSYNEGSVDITVPNGPFKTFSDTLYPQYESLDSIRQQEPMKVAGIQNVFDGYTFISANNMACYSPCLRKYQNAFCGGAPAVLDPYSYEGFNLVTNEYMNPRIFVKNKMPYKSNWFTPSNYPDLEKYRTGEVGAIPTNSSVTYNNDPLSIDDGVLDKSIDFNKPDIDRYFYYTYDETLNDKVTYKDYTSLYNDIVQHENIRFETITGRLGYVKSIDPNRIKYNYDYYGVGEYLLPTEIRDRLIAENQFTSTSISSDQAFGGLLVIDNSGRNVMFLENTNESPLTGNAVCYPTPVVNDGKDLLMLEVK